MSVTWLDQPAARAELLRAVQELVRRRPEIERVVLFGSLATGRAVPGSDADLLIILKSSDRPFPERIPIYTPDVRQIGVDVFPYTQAELEHLLASRSSFVKRALAEGIELIAPPQTFSGTT